MTVFIFTEDVFRTLRLNLKKSRQRGKGGMKANVGLDQGSPGNHRMKRRD